MKVKLFSKLLCHQNNLGNAVSLTQADLADPQLLREGRDALDRLTQILQLGSVYPFQQ